MRVAAASSTFLLVGASAVAVVVVVLRLDHRPGMDQGRISVARAMALLRRLPLDAEMRIVEVLTDQGGKAVGRVDSPATGVGFTQFVRLRHVQPVGADRRDTAPAPSSDPGCRLRAGSSSFGRPTAPWTSRP